MKRLPVVLAVGVAAVLMVVGWVVTASGAPSPGTVQTFEVRIKAKDFAINCGNKPQPACFRGKPRLASVGAGSGTVYVNGERKGTAVFANITGKKLKKDTVDLFFATLVLNGGADTISAQGATLSEGSSLPYSVTGGTGAYAGARGTVVDSDAPGSTNQEFRINVTVTFL